MKLSKKYNLLFFVIPGLVLFLFYFYYGSLIGGDTTRYVNAGYKTLEYFGIIFESLSFSLLWIRAITNSWELIYNPDSEKALLSFSLILKS